MNIIITIAISIIVTCSVSAMFGLGAMLIGYQFWPTFLIMTGLQIIINGLWQIIISSKEKLQIERLKVDSALIESIQYVNVYCEYCKFINNVPLLLNRENIFECAHCKNKNKIILEISTVRTTDEINTKANMANLFEKIDQQIPEDINKASSNGPAITTKQ
jgi:hypothetical protein